MSNIPKAWIQAVQSGAVKLVDPTKEKYENPFDTPEYQAFVEEMAKTCKCCPEFRPCDGCLAGGLCDQTECRMCRGDDFQEVMEEFEE